MLFNLSASRKSFDFDYFKRRKGAVGCCSLTVFGISCPSIICTCLIFSINGENKHYGTLTNPTAHVRVLGGSCSGSAVAVAAGFVDYSLGKILRVAIVCLVESMCMTSVTIQPRHHAL